MSSGSSITQAHSTTSAPTRSTNQNTVIRYDPSCSARRENCSFIRWGIDVLKKRIKEKNPSSSFNKGRVVQGHETVGHLTRLVVALVISMGWY